MVSRGLGEGGSEYKEQSEETLWGTGVCLYSVCGNYRSLGVYKITHETKHKPQTCCLQISFKDRTQELLNYWQYSILTWLVLSEIVAVFAYTYCMLSFVCMTHFVSYKGGAPCPDPHS